MPVLRAVYQMDLAMTMERRLQGQNGGAEAEVIAAEAAVASDTGFPSEIVVQGSRPSSVPFAMAIFPLPPVCGVRAATLPERELVYANDCIDSLNSLQGSGFRPAPHTNERTAEKEINLQQEGHAAILRASQRWAGAGVAPSCSSAGDSVMKGRGDYSASAHSSMAPYQSSMFSILENVR